MSIEIEIVEEKPEALIEYEKVSIAFQVKKHFRVEVLNQGLGGIKFVEESVAPYLKDYDAIPEERPSFWSRNFDLSNWGILSAFVGGQRIGGAAIAWNTPEITMLEGRKDLACLWDLRVATEYRSKGVGQQLFTCALDWARKRECAVFKVETQNINVPACRFYAAQGCELGAVNRYCYPKFMNEVQLIWYRNV